MRGPILCYAKYPIEHLSSEEFIGLVHVVAEKMGISLLTAHMDLSETCGLFWEVD